LNKATAPYEAVFFDFDGVLVDSEPLHFRCWKEVLEGVGIALEWEIYAACCIGVSEERMYVLLSDWSGLPVETFRRLYPVKSKLFRERSERELSVPVATVALIRALTYYKLAVVSSSNILEVEPALIRAGIRFLLGTLVTGGDVVNHKPAPDPYLLAARRLEIKTALVLEDSPAGIASATAAGFKVLRVGHVSEVPDLVRSALSNL